MIYIYMRTGPHVAYRPVATFGTDAKPEFVMLLHAAQRVAVARGNMQGNTRMPSCCMNTYIYIHMHINSCQWIQRSRAASSI